MGKSTRSVRHIYGPFHRSDDLLHYFFGNPQFSIGNINSLQLKCAQALLCCTVMDCIGIIRFMFLYWCLKVLALTTTKKRIGRVESATVNNSKTEALSTIKLTDEAVTGGSTKLNDSAKSRMPTKTTSVHNRTTKGNDAIMETTSGNCSVRNEKHKRVNVPWRIFMYFLIVCVIFFFLKKACWEKRGYLMLNEYQENMRSRSSSWVQACKIGDDVLFKLRRSLATVAEENDDEFEII